MSESDWDVFWDSDGLVPVDCWETSSTWPKFPVGLPIGQIPTLYIFSMPIGHPILSHNMECLYVLLPKISYIIANVLFLSPELASYWYFRNKMNFWNIPSWFKKQQSMRRTAAPRLQQIPGRKIYVEIQNSPFWLTANSLNFNSAHSFFQ